MKKTLVELFAGVGGFRVGLNHVQLKNDDLKKKFKKYKISEEEYKLPIFEIYNLYNKSLKWKIKYICYKLLYKIS